MASGNKFLFLALIVHALLAMNTGGFAQVATLIGQVKELDGSPLSSATIIISGTDKGTVADSTGMFRLRVPANEDFSVTFSYVGFDSLVFQKLNLAPGEIRRLEVVLKEKTTLLEQVEIISDADRRSVSVVDIQPRAAKLLPSAFGDFTRILSTLPGVVTTNELSSAYSVRGGNYDENLVYINGFKVYRPFLVRAGRQEGLSAINTNLTKEAKFFSGGWNATYGDKLSSVLDVTYRKPTKFGGSVSLGLLGGSLNFEGQSGNDRFSYLVGARNKRGRYLLNTLDVKGEYFPDFTDVQGLLSYKLGGQNPDRTRLDLFTSYASNRYRVVPETRETEFGTFDQPLRFLVAFEGQEQLNYNTWQAGLNLFHQINFKTTLSITLSGINTLEKEYGDVEGGYRLCDVDKNPNSASFNECVSIRGIGTNYFHSRNTLEGNILNFDIKVSQSIEDRSYFQYGLEYDYSNFDDYLEEYTFIDSADYVRINYSILSPAQTKASIWSGFFQHNISVGLNGELEYGFRLSYRDLNDQWLISPRVQYSLQPSWTHDVVFKAAAGLYQQQPLYREMRDLSGNLNTELKAQQSAHFIMGLDYNFKIWTRPFKWTTEVYYKYLWDVVPYDINNVRIRYFAENIAVAYATGLDTRISGEFIPGTESWFSMSLLSTRENIEGDDRGYIRRPTDQHITLAVVFEDHLPNNPSLRVNLGLVYGSGVPFGPPNDIENRNIFNADNYQRVDIGFSKIFDFSESSNFQVFRLGLEILNLFGVSNTISYTWIQDYSGRNIAIPNTLSNRFFNIKLTLDF